MPLEYKFPYNNASLDSISPDEGIDEREGSLVGSSMIIFIQQRGMIIKGKGSVLVSLIEDSSNFCTMEMVPTPGSKIHQIARDNGVYDSINLVHSNPHQVTFSIENSGKSYSCIAHYRPKIKK
jgi:hypothetical protein